MRPITRKLLLLEGCAAIALLVAAVYGEMSLHANGLHVPQQAFRDTGLTILRVSAVSYVLATMLLEGFRVYRTRAEALGFVASAAVGWLAASAFANTDVKIFGTDAEWISWLAMIWLFALILQFAVHSSCARQVDPPEPNGSATG